MCTSKIKNSRSSPIIDFIFSVALCLTLAVKSMSQCPDLNHTNPLPAFFISKMIYDDPYLYLAGSSGLYKGEFIQDSLNIIDEVNYGSCYDMKIKNDYIALGTDRGLYILDKNGLLLVDYFSGLLDSTFVRAFSIDFGSECNTIYASIAEQDSDVVYSIGIMKFTFENQNLSPSLFIQTENWQNKLSADGDHLFVASPGTSNSSLFAMDFSESDTLVSVNLFDQSPLAYSIRITDNRLYVGNHAGILSYTLDDWFHPALIGLTVTPQSGTSGTGIEIFGDTLYSYKSMQQGLGTRGFSAFLVQQDGQLEPLYSKRKNGSQGIDAIARYKDYLISAWHYPHILDYYNVICPEPVEDLTIAIVEGQAVLSWSEAIHANMYLVYASNSLTTDSWASIDSVLIPSLSIPVRGDKMFFEVKAIRH